MDTNGTKPPETNGEITPARRKRRLPVLKIFLLFVALDAAAAGYWFYLSPQAKVKKTVREMAAAFEAEDLDTLSSRISGSYSDPGGNTKDSIEGALSLFFELCDNLKASDDKVVVQVRDGVATVAVTGRITYRFRGAPQRTKYNEDNPFIITLEREEGRWLVTSMPQASEPLSDAGSTAKEISSF